LGISIIFILAISIFALVGGSIKYWDQSLGCDSKYKGVLDAYASIDSYIIEADTDFCSSDCPCYMNSTVHEEFITNTTAVPYYNMWHKTPAVSGAIKFSNCSEIVRNKTHDDYVSVNAYTNYTFDANMFSDYYGHVEEWFNCTGFCMTTYYNERLKTNMGMYKYIFSDIGRGVPEHIGCLKPILRWLPLVLNAFGSIGLFVSCFEGFVLYLAIAMLCTKGEDEHEHKGVVTEKDAEKKETERKESEKPKDGEKGIEMARQ
jgi:hypothetical protein